MTPPRLLLAIDMDGTLLRDDKTIAPVDSAAVRNAAEHGIAVTLATGRLATGALPAARELGLSLPLVCADGGLLIDPQSGKPLHRHAIPASDAVQAVRVLLAHGLIPFVFLADAIHCEPPGERHRGLLSTWSRDLVIHDSLVEAEVLQLPDSVALTVGVGTQEAVLSASRELKQAQGHALDSVHFGMGGETSWAVRSLPHGCDKAAMLARLAAQMGVAREQVAVIGDWLNDLGMFAYAGRSFAMGQAPEIVRGAATDVLRSTSSTGGGVAEAIAALCQDTKRR